MHFIFLIAFVFAGIAHAESDLTLFVNPFIGTANSSISSGAVPGGVGGATQPAAVVPFGMVQIGPDTNKPETSGYKYENTAIRHFSFTHMSGPGCRNMGEMAFTPYVGKAIWPALDGQTFNHSKEMASPGYYSVQMDSGTTVELTATERTGFIRLNFPQAKIGDTVGLLLNTNIVGDGNTSGSIVLSKDRGTLFATVISGRFCASKGTYKTHLALRIKKPALVSIKDGIARLEFKYEGQALLFKAGVSLVSPEGALLNLTSEAPHFEFDLIKNSATKKWNQALSTVKIKTSASLERQRVFYTALYHSLLHPNVGSDVDGRYLGFDNKIHQDSQRTYYVNYSGWDIYRSQIQLLAFLFPHRASDMAQSLVNQGLQGGALPKWSLNNVETNIMAGDPGSLMVAGLYAFGADDFDKATALQLMKKNALDPSVRSQGQIVRHGAADYNSLGFIRHSKIEWASASTALELTVADYGIAQFARSQGDQELAQILSQRSGNWLNIWDPEQKHIRPRLDANTWVDSFQPNSTVGFMEGNSSQYTWMIPHDLTRLIEKMGGDKSAIERLDAFVSEANAGQNDPHLYLGNEPSFGVPWIYLWAHAPWRTQEVVRNLLVEQFKDGPGGLAGNDDLGALSSWAVWSSMGLFPAVPGTGLVTFGNPEFSEILITPEGKTPLRILAPQGETHIYVKNLEIDSKATERSWTTFEHLQKSQVLQFTMSPQRELWGSKKGEEPFIRAQISDD